jgi:hypothetical protein
LFLGLLGKLVRIDTVQTVLIEMGDMIGGQSRSGLDQERGRGKGTFNKEVSLTGFVR